MQTSKRFIKTVRGLLVATAVCLTAVPVWPLEIVFKNEAVVDADTIYLKDIAVIQATDTASGRIGKLMVAAAPAPGETLALSRQFLQYKLGPSLANGSPARLILQDQVVVKRSAQWVEHGQLEEVFKEYIRKHAPWKRDEIFFGRVSAPGTMALPKGRLAIEVQPNAGEDWLGHVFLTVNLKVDEQVVRRVSLSGEVLLQREVVRAARGIERGEIIAKEDLSLTEEKIRDLRPEANIRLEDIVGKQATRHIQSGQIFTSQMTQAVPLVQKGKRVVIRAESGRLTVTATGVVQENGQQGDQVKVVNMSSNKMVIATVSGPGLVTVQF